MSRKRSILINLFVALSMLLTLFAVQPLNPAAWAAPAQSPNVPRPLGDSKAVAEKEVEVTKEEALAKIDPALREAAQYGGKDLVDVFVSVAGGADLESFLTSIILRPEVFHGLRTIYGKTQTSNLIKIAQISSVVSVFDASLKGLDRPADPEMANAPDTSALEARMAELRANEVSYAEAEAKNAANLGAQDWFDVLDGHKSSEAWKKGFDGSGAIVAVVDDGVDFGHPDLMNTYAWVTDQNSPYYGWPMAFSQASTQYFAYDVFLGTNYIASGATASRWAAVVDTFEQDSSFEVGTATHVFKPNRSAVAYKYTFPTTSQSSIYKMASFVDENLRSLYGHDVAVLVVDEHQAGSYDTVYVDLDNDHDFTDEKPATQNSPQIYRDMDGDGYTDISGGLLVWISDGDNPPPTADWLWGVTCADSSATMAGCPDSGDLLIFAGAYAAGYTHGTQCASNVAAQGVVSGGLDAQPFRVGGMVQGAAPNVGVMDMGTLYQTFSDEEHYLVAGLGYDGVPNSGDEIQVATNSYGAFTQMWGSWGPKGRFLTALNLGLAPTTTYIFSAGNEGPGYGPQEGDGGPTTIMAGSSTQYGTTNWDSIVSADQIMYGDPNSFFSKGPNRDGTSGLDVLGNGGRGAGDEGINYFGYNGAESWDTWGGTSRSAPVVGGNLALIYQAYKERYGEWPTWDVARALLKSGATNSVSSPFLQGGGVVNADRSTDLAAGIYGVYAMPDEWDVGDWQGEKYLNFAKVAVPGETYNQTYTITNPSGYNIDVDLSQGAMTLMDSMELTFTTSSESEESSFNFHSPDYLMALDPADIPADAELMVVRYVHPYSTFDPNYSFTANPESSWRFLLYNWTDVNGDDKLWEDANGNGTVNHADSPLIDNDGFHRLDFTNTEIQEGEYIRVDYEFGGLAVPIAVRDPLNRMADGYFFGLQHRYNDHSVDHTTFKIGVEFYKRAEWSWLSLSDNALTVPAESTATFEASVTVPAGTAPGAYEAVIFMNDPGDANHAAHETALPVMVNVMADLPNGGSVTLGGGAKTNQLYQNSWTNGYFNWYGGGWTGAGDWRHYFLNLDENDAANGNLLIHTSWNDGYPTDINTWLLGPTADCASNGAGCNFYETYFTTLPIPEAYGPYTLWPIAGSDSFHTGATYPFNTSTGGPDDWMTAPIENPGLHEIALHNVLYSGENLAAQFQVDVGTINMVPTMDPAVGSASIGSVDADVYTDTGQIDLNFTPSIAIPDLYASLSGGLATTSYGPFTELVPDNGGCYSATCTGNVVVPFMMTDAGATRLHTHLYVTAGQDADLFLVYDSNDNGSLDSTDFVAGSSGNSAGTDEDIVVNNPALGRYFTSIAGYNVDPDSGVNLDWIYEITAPGDLSSDPADVFTNTVTINQDSKFDLATSSYSLTVTTDKRTSALYADLTSVPAGADVDLFVTDENGVIVAQSQTSGDEHVEVLPVDNYRFGQGHDFTVWVHGFDVPTPPVTPHLHVWKDELNLWLSAEHPDVHVSEIGAGETVSVTLNFEKKGMNLGDILSARLVAGPSVLPGAFDELVTLTRTDPPVPSPDAAWLMSAESERGPSPFLSGGYPTFLANTGDTITFTLDIENTGDAAGAFFGAAYIPIGWEVFTGFVVTDTVTTYIPDYFGDGSFDLILYTVNLAPGETSTNAYNVTFNNVGGGTGWAVSNYFDVFNDTSGYYYGGDIVRAYIRSFRLDGSAKTSLPDTVAPGGDFSYTISLSNPSAVDQDVFVSDPLPAEVEFVSASPGVNYDAGSHSVTWGGTVPGSTLKSTDLTIDVRAMADEPEGSSFTNEATAALKFDGTPIYFMSADTLVDDGMNPNLVVSKSVDNLRGHTGTKLQYTITVENTGDEDATGAEVMDEIPSMLDVDEASVTGDAMYMDGALSWTGDLAVGASKTFSFQATINDTATLDYALINAAKAWAENTASISFNSAITEISGFYEFYMPMIHQN